MLEGIENFICQIWSHSTDKIKRSVTLQRAFFPLIYDGLCVQTFALKVPKKMDMCYRPIFVSPYSLWGKRTNGLYESSDCFHSWKFLRYLMFTLEMSWCSWMVMRHLHDLAFRGIMHHDQRWNQNYQKVPYTNVGQNQAKSRLTLTAFTREGKVIVLRKMICRRCSLIWAGDLWQTDEIWAGDFCHSVVDKHLFSLQWHCIVWMDMTHLCTVLWLFCFYLSTTVALESVAIVAFGEHTRFT